MAVLKVGVTKVRLFIDQGKVHRRKEGPTKKEKAIALDTTARYDTPEGKQRKKKNRERPVFSALREHAPCPSGVAHQSFREKVT